MSNDFFRPVRRRRSAAVVTVFVVVAVLTVGAAGYAIYASRHNGDGAARASAATATSAGTVPSDTGPGDGPLRLVPGRSRVDGVAVGYPHTMVGAVSAAAEYLTQICSTLDLDRARAIGKVVADATFTDAQDYLGDAPVNTRRRLGLPTSGPVPANASVVLDPAAYQLRQAERDSMIVLILGFLTTSTPSGAVVSRVGVFPLEMRWDGSDWKLLRPDVSARIDYSGLSAQPGTPDAAAKGWRELTNE